MSKIILKTNTQIKYLKNEIWNLQSECGKLYRAGRDTGEFDSLKHDKLSDEIKRLEYLVWGAENGILK